MNWADYSIIALLGFSCIVGFMRGLLREVISLITWLLAATLAWRLGTVLEPHLGGALTSPLIRPWAARGIIFVGILLVGTAAGAIISHFVRLSIFSVWIACLAHSSVRCAAWCCSVWWRYSVKPSS